MLDIVDYAGKWRRIHMDRLVEVRSGGLTIAINPSKVRSLAAGTIEGVPHAGITLDGGEFYTVAGSVEQVAKALGYHLEVFDPLSGLSKASDANVEAPRD